MNDRIVDHRWPYVVLCFLLFAGGMAFLHWMTHGFSRDFGFGFSVGAVTGLAIAFAAFGWKWQELMREEGEQ